MSAAVIASLSFTACQNNSDAPPPAAQTSNVGAISDPVLQDKFDRAAALQKNTDIERDTVRAAWTDFRDSAKTANPPAPSLVGLAHIKLASFEYEEGNIDTAIAYAELGLEQLRAEKLSYMDEYSEGISVLGLMYTQVGRHTDAEPLLRQGIADYNAFFAGLDKGELKRDSIISKSNAEFAFSQFLTRQGRVDEALEYQRQSLKTRRDGLGPTDVTTIQSHYGLAQVLLKAGLAQEAEDNARLAVSLAVEHLKESDPAYARSLEMLGIVLSRTGRRIEAADYLTRALDIKRREIGPENLYFAYGVHNLGTIQQELERYHIAQQLLIEADIGFSKHFGETSPFAIGSLTLAGQSLLADGQPEKAAEYFKIAETRLRAAEGDDADIWMRLQPFQSAAQLALGDNAAALDTAQRYYDYASAAYAPGALSRDLAALLRVRASGESTALSAHTLMDTISRSQFLSGTGELSNNLRFALEAVLESAAETNDVDLALRAGQLIVQSKASHSAARMRARAAAGSPDLEAAIRDLQDAKSALSALDAKWLKPSLTGEERRDVQVQREAAQANVDDRSSALKRSFPNLSEADNPAAPLASDLQSTLSGGEAIIGIFPAFSQSYVISVTADQRAIYRARRSRAWHQNAVEDLRDGLPVGAFDTVKAAELYAALFGQADLTGIDSVQLVTAGGYTTLPFAVLRTDADPSNSQGWFIDKFAYAMRPDFQLNPINTDSSDRPRAGFLGVGAPQPYDTKPDAEQTISSGSAGLYYRNARADKSALASLPPLPDARAELREMGRTLNAKPSLILTGAKANEDAIKTMDLTPYGVLAFATHGLVAGEMDGVAESALVLSPPKDSVNKLDDNRADGLLNASEIAQLRLNADWVILSACNTAAGDARSAAAYSGLGQAFIYAGARNLLVSHWVVRDDAAAFLTTRTVEAAVAENNLSKAKALQRAMIELRDQSGLRGADDPMIWAPFVLLQP